MESWRGNEKQGRGSSLFAANLLVSPLSFDRLCLLLGSVSLVSRCQGRRDHKPSLRKGQSGGHGGLRGWAGLGGGLTEDYKYLVQPDDHTVSQLVTDGSALTGRSATSAPPQTLADHPPSPSLFLSLSLLFSLMMVAGKIFDSRSQSDLIRV